MAGVDLVITDIDGTLVLPGKHNPTISVRKAVADLEIAGVTLSAATGRPYEMAKNLFLDVGLKDECVFDNGATIRNVKTGKIIWQNWLDTERLKQIFEILVPHATIIDFFPDWREADASKATAKDITEPAPYGFALVEAEEASRLAEMLSSFGNLNVFKAPSYEDLDLMGIQVTDIKSDKYHAVNHLREMVHEGKNKVLSIGDGPNDIPLFQAADIKVAMGNATDELKAVADHIVAPVEQDGFAEAMRKFVLN